MEAALVISIVQAVLTYGPNAVIAISKALEEGKRTPEEIKALFIEKEPWEYFK
jgi:hypothetical protein